MSKKQLGPFASVDEEPVYVLQRQPFPDRGETRIEIWFKDDGVKLSSYEISKLLADTMHNLIKPTPTKPNQNLSEVDDERNI